MNRNHPFFAPLIDATPSRRTMLQTMALGAAAMLMSSFSRKSFADTPATSPSGAGSSGNGPIATTTYGKVRGFMDNGVNVFKGIPYGDDTRKRRFQPPVPPPAWSDVMDTVAFGPAAPVAARAPSTNPSTNPSTQPARRREMVPPVQNENCLHLNIWTPAVGDGGKRPVMVYIHGGAYSSGTSNSDLYDGVNLCKQGDVVVVTMNHRLNIFGYLYLAEIGGPEYADSGNVGMLDLILMLQWVRDNIAEFGGDPGNILIYGQSGGGAKCATLMSMPAARGLFHRVITMSGQQITARETAAAMKSTQKVLDALKLTKNDIAKLNDLSVAELIGALSGQYFGPVLDGRSVARDPFSPDAPPLSADIPMILGNTHDETSMLLGNSDPTLFSITWDEVPAKLDKVIKQFMGKLTGAEVVADFRKMHPDYTPAQVFFGATTAFRSWRGQVIEAERRAQQGGPGATYVYQLNWGPTHDGARWAGHTNDIALSFNNLGKGNDIWALDEDPVGQKLADIMSDVWITFARTGNPQTAEIPTWPQYDLKNRSTMIWDIPPRIENDPRGDERRLAETQVYVQPGTRD